MNGVTQAVDALNEELVVRAEEIVQAMGQQAGGLEDLSKSQLARAIDVARNARSPRVFHNWLAYQAGRDQTRPFWTQPIGNRQLIHRVRETVEFIEDRLNEKLLPDQRLRQEAVTEALVRFLGFLRRSLVGRHYLLGGRNR